MILEIFIPMVFANNLQFESENLSYAVYSSNWLNLSMKNRKAFVLLQEGSKKALTIRCYHWLNLVLPTLLIQQSFKPRTNGTH